MSRAYRCDGPCGQFIARDGDVTILKAHVLGRDDQSPWLGVKMKGRTYVHLCPACMGLVAAIAVHDGSTAAVTATTGEEEAMGS